MNPFVDNTSTDAGMSLVELMIAVVILGVVGSVVAGTVVQVTRVFVNTQEEGQGLRDAKLVMDAVARDVREASNVVCDGVMPDGTSDAGCSRHLELWIDENANYLGPPQSRDPQELVIWYVRKSSDDIHCDVIREQDGRTKVLANSLVVESASGQCRTFFNYDPTNPEEASLVTVSMYYDPKTEGGVAERLASTSARLRNG